MKNSALYLTLSGLVLISFLGCQKPEDRSAANGTVDGGGGNIFCDQKTQQCSLLDLVENKDREPFLFDNESLVEKEFPKDPETQSQHKSAMVIYNGDQSLKTIFGENSDFMNWYLGFVINSNSDSYDQNQTMLNIGLEAFNLAEKKIKNLQYYLTDKELPLLKDQGFLAVDNPESLKQLALQDNTGHVLIQKQQFEKLDLQSKYALKLHESMLYLLLNFNNDHLKKNGTAKIRNFVKQFLTFTYVSNLKGSRLVDINDVKSAYSDLQLPLVKATYERIAETSQNSQDLDRICKLKRDFFVDPTTGKIFKTANYFFAKGEQRVSNNYAMDAEFYMKIQIYLVNKGICIFKPVDCEIKWIDAAVEPLQEHQGYAVVANGEALPEANRDIVVVQQNILKKYQTAQICK